MCSCLSNSKLNFFSCRCVEIAMTENVFAVVVVVVVFDIVDYILYVILL